MLPETRISSAAAFAEAIGVPLTGDRGHSLAQSLGRPTTRRKRHGGDRPHRRGHVRGRRLLDRAHGPLQRRARLRGRLGRRRVARSSACGSRPGVGIAGAVVASGDGVFVPECRKDPRFARQVAAGTGYVPYTMVVAPLVREGKTIGCLSVLDRRDGGPYLREDLGKVALFADLAVVALDLDTFPLSSSRRPHPPGLRRRIGRHRPRPGRRGASRGAQRVLIDAAISFAASSRSPWVALTVIAMPPQPGSLSSRSEQLRFAHSGTPKFFTVAKSDSSALDFSGLRFPDSNVPGFAFSLGVWKMRMTAVVAVGEYVDPQVAARRTGR